MFYICNYRLVIIQPRGVFPQTLFLIRCFWTYGYFPDEFWHQIKATLFCFLTKNRNHFLANCDEHKKQNYFFFYCSILNAALSVSLVLFFSFFLKKKKSNYPNGWKTQLNVPVYTGSTLMPRHHDGWRDVIGVKSSGWHLKLWWRCEIQRCNPTEIEAATFDMWHKQKRAFVSSSKAESLCFHWCECRCCQHWDVQYFSVQWKYCVFEV